MLFVEHGFDFRTREKTITLSHGVVTKINTSSIYVKTDDEKSDNTIRFKNVKNPVYSDWVFGTISLFHSEDEYIKQKRQEMDALLDDAIDRIERLNYLQHELNYNDINLAIDVLTKFVDESWHIKE